MKKLIITILLVFSMTVPAFADGLDAKLTGAKREVDNHIDQVASNTVLSAYPDGTVYFTTEDIDEAEMSERFGGEWRCVEYTFFWGTDGSENNVIDEDGDEINDETGEPINNMNRIGGRGGKREYLLAAGIASDDDGFSFWTDEDTGYVDNTAVVLEATSYAIGDLAYSVLVVDNSSETETTTIMPPFTRVKAFERVAGSADDDDLGDDEP